MVRKKYHDTDPGTPGHDVSVHVSRQGPMRGYFNSMPGSYNVNDCDCLQEVFEKYPELETMEHRLAVLDLWKAGGHMVDPD